MGVTFGVMCLDCGEDGPEVGDFGYIGYPSLSEDKGRRYVPNFGYIYRGLVTLGMRTQAVEELRAFLVEHQSHQMEMSCEGEPMFGEDDEADDEEEDEEDEEDDGEEDEEDEDEDDEEEDDDDDGEEEGEADDESADEDDNEGPLRVNPENFIDCYYEASCPRCGKTVRSKWGDRALPFEAKKLTKDEARDALHRITVDESFERASEPFGPEDFDGICRFLGDHGAHGPKVALIPKV